MFKLRTRERIAIDMKISGGDGLDPDKALCCETRHPLLIITRCAAIMGQLRDIGIIKDEDNISESFFLSNR